MDDRGAVEETVGIVAAHVVKHSVTPSDLPALIATVHKALLAVTGRGEPEPEPVKPPAVSIRRSIQPDHLVCLEDGRKFKSLKRHLRTAHNLDTGGYRAKWGLAKDYPMTAASYSRARSAIAKATGLGSGDRKAARGARRATKA